MRYSKDRLKLGVRVADIASVPEPFARTGGIRPEVSAVVAPSFALCRLPDPNQAAWEATSLFSGCGGLDLGFLQEGVLSRAAFDIDRRALVTYTHNLPSMAVQTNLATCSPGPSVGRILLAGAPCQGFSTVGKRLVGDPRNALLMRVADVALEGRFDVVIVENVPAAISGSHRRLWEALEDRLRFAGFNVRRVLLEADKCGLGQHRRRLFLVCWRGSDCINVQVRPRRGITLREALAAVDGAEDHDIVWPERSGEHWLIARRIPAGHKLSNVRLSDRAVATWDIPEVYGQTSKAERELLTAVTKLRRRERVRSYGDGDPVTLDRLTKELRRGVKRNVARLVSAGYLRSVGDAVELCHTYNGRYRRLQLDSISPTVDTKFGRIDLFLHPTENRAVTPREAARIQGFPDSFKFIGHRNHKFVQIGNAVPPPMAASLAEFVREAILKA